MKNICNNNTNIISYHTISLPEIKFVFVRTMDEVMLHTNNNLHVSAYSRWRCCDNIFTFASFTHMNNRLIHRCPFYSHCRQIGAARFDFKVTQPKCHYIIRPKTKKLLHCVCVDSRRIDFDFKWLCIIWDNRYLVAAMIRYAMLKKSLEFRGTRITICVIYGAFEREWNVLDVLIEKKERYENNGYLFIWEMKKN